MSATADPRPDRDESKDDDRTWVASPLSRDLAGLLAWTLVGLLIFYVALVGLILGQSALWTYIWLFPVTLVLVGLIDLFTILPITTARRIGAGSTGLGIVRFRKVDEYPWSGVRPGFRPPWTWPFIGHRYPASLSGSPNTQPPSVGLTRAQAELIAAHFGKTVEETWLPRSIAKRRE
ncbi:MAG: hypothetical protein ACLP8Y_02735 [Thermoplasmata archaeon]